MNNRIGNKWTVNEVLALQREYELLGWDMDKMAKKHRRTAKAIMFKLDQEGFANYTDLSNEYSNLNCDISHGSLNDDVANDDTDEEELLLTSRVSKLESGLSEIKDMIKVLTYGRWQGTAKTRLDSIHVDGP